MAERSWFRSRDFVAALVALLLAVGGVAALKLMPAADSDDAEAAAEFRTELMTESKTISGMIDETKSGKNISEMRLGMFMMNLLSGLAEDDDGLGAYFHKDNRLMQDYLTDVFQYHSGDEVAHVAALAKQGHPAIRESAQYALESLRHIPVSKDPPDAQDKDRKALADTLTTLNAKLAQAANE